MRRAYQNQYMIIENGTFYGVSLGWDFTAEHEWGIDGMKRKFGINSSKIGLPGRKITTGEVIFKEEKNRCILTSRKPWGKAEFTFDDLVPYDIKSMRGGFETAWDEGDFCVITTNKEYFPYLKELYNAFLTHNVAITFLKTDIL